MDLKNEFSTKIAKKIFGNSTNAENFLLQLKCKKEFELPYKKITKGKNKGNKTISLSSDELWSTLVRVWDFELGLSIVREMFKATEKYKAGKESKKAMNTLIEEWKKLGFDEKISWPFSQGNFDGFVQMINSEKNTTAYEKDEKVKLAAVKYRRIKAINTVRNDFIETLIFEKNTNILPTLNHTRGVDFFINGVAYDQKVAKSPTNEFKKKYGENWKNEAIKNPAKVAEFLYKHQDEGRFGADSRLLIVYLDEDVSIEQISKTLNSVNLEKPLEITFDYIHKKGKPDEKRQTYQVKCFVILLTKEKI